MNGLHHSLSGEQLLGLLPRCQPAERLFGTAIATGQWVYRQRDGKDEIAIFCAVRAGQTLSDFSDLFNERNWERRGRLTIATYYNANVFREWKAGRYAYTIDEAGHFHYWELRWRNPGVLHYPSTAEYTYRDRLTGTQQREQVWKSMDASSTMHRATAIRHAIEFPIHT